MNSFAAFEIPKMWKQLHLQTFNHCKRVIRWVSSWQVTSAPCKPIDRSASCKLSVTAEVLSDESVIDRSGLSFNWLGQHRTWRTIQQRPSSSLFWGWPLPAVFAWKGMTTPWHCTSTNWQEHFVNVIMYTCTQTLMTCVQNDSETEWSLFLALIVILSFVADLAESTNQLTLKR